MREPHPRILMNLILLVLLTSGSVSWPSGSTAARAAGVATRPELPRATLISSGSAVGGSPIQDGVVAYYYWEDRGSTHTYYGGAFSPDYRMPWPKPVTYSSKSVRIRLGRASPPTADWQFSAWSAVQKDTRFPRGPRFRASCRLTPNHKCALVPTVDESGNPSWDAVINFPSKGHYFISIIPAWANLEAASPNEIQEVQWLFHIQI